MFALQAAAEGGGAQHFGLLKNEMIYKLTEPEQLI